MAATTLSARLPEELLLLVARNLPPRSLAALLQVDRLRDYSDHFWRELATSKAQANPAQPAALRLSRSQTNPWRTCLRSLRQRRDRLKQGVDDIAVACFGRDAIRTLRLFMVDFPEFKEEASMRLHVTVPFRGTLLHVASRRNRRETVRELIQIGADLDIQDENGLTPLAGASWAGHIKCVFDLLYAGADLRPQGTPPMTSSCGGKGPYDAETWAQRKGLVEIVKILEPIRLEETRLRAAGAGGDGGAELLMWRRAFLTEHARRQRLNKFGVATNPSKWIFPIYGGGGADAVPPLPAGDSVGHPLEPWCERSNGIRSYGSVVLH